MNLKIKNTVDYVNITNLISSPIFMQSPPTKPDIKTNTSTIPATLQALSSPLYLLRLYEKKPS